MPAVNAGVAVAAFWNSVLLTRPLTPNLAPSSRVKSSLATTMRDSISTCCTGLSSTAIRSRSCLIFSGVSLSSSVLVRSSYDTLPRGDRKPRWVLPPPVPPPPCLLPVVSSLAMSDALP